MNDFKGSAVVQAFYGMIERAIDRRGVCPHQAIAKVDDCLEVMALDLPPLDLLRHVQTMVTTRPVQELVYGLDRSTKPGQGTEFADVLTFMWYDGQAWTPGVINYQDSPRIVRPIDWDNAFWNEFLLANEGPRLKPFYRVVKGAT